MIYGKCAIFVTKKRTIEFFSYLTILSTTYNYSEFDAFEKDSKNTKDLILSVVIVTSWLPTTLIIPFKSAAVEIQTKLSPEELTRKSPALNVLLSITTRPSFNWLTAIHLNVVAKVSFV